MDIRMSDGSKEPLVPSGGVLVTTELPKGTVYMDAKPEGGGKYWRQMDFLDPEKLNEYSILVVGAGAVGSWATLALAKMGAQNVSVWDKDVVELHNASVQVYSSREVGKKKAYLLADWVDKLADNGMRINAVAENIDADTVNLVCPSNAIMVMAVDNMPARRHLWDLAKANPKIKLVVDVRSSGDVLRVYAVNPQDPQHEAFYEGQFYDGRPGEAMPCTRQAISFSSFFSAAFIASTVAAFVNGHPFYNEVVFNTLNFRISKGRA